MFANNIVGQKLVGRFGEYQASKIIGSGSEGIIYLGTDKNGQEIIIKGCPKISQKQVELINYLIKYPKPNLIKFFDLFQIPTLFILIMEYAKSGDLFKMIKQNDKITESCIIDIALQVSEGLQQLNQLKLFHRDLKPENIVLMGTTFKLIDFGLIKSLKDPKVTLNVGTVFYKAPEQLKDYYRQEIDVWALGCIIYELYKKKTLVTGQTHRECQMFIENYETQQQKRDDILDTQLSRLADPRIIKLVQRMVNFNVDARPKPAEIIEELKRIKQVGLDVGLEQKIIPEIQLQQVKNLDISKLSEVLTNPFYQMAIDKKPEDIKKLVDLIYQY